VASGLSIGSAVGRVARNDRRTAEGVEGRLSLPVGDELIERIDETRRSRSGSAT
jgi:hypothetical protein